jgi:hypothetical protein
MAVLESGEFRDDLRFHSFTLVGPGRSGSNLP